MNRQMLIVTLPIGAALVGAAAAAAAPLAACNFLNMICALLIAAATPCDPMRVAARGFSGRWFPHGGERPHRGEVPALIAF